MKKGILLEARLTHLPVNNTTKHLVLSPDTFTYDSILHQTGKYGEVWTAHVHTMHTTHPSPCTIAIKRQPLRGNDELLMKTFRPYQTTFRLFQSDRRAWRDTVWEVWVLEHLNRMVRQAIVPGFVLFIGCGTEDNVKYTNENVKLSPKSPLRTVLMGMELAHMDLRTWASTLHTTREWQSAMFQIVFSILAYQKYLRIQHNDLHWSNILIWSFQNCEQHDETQYLVYRFRGHPYYVPFTGQLFLIADFGLLSPLETVSSMKDIRRLSFVGHWMQNRYQITTNPFLIQFHDLCHRTETMMELLSECRRFLRRPFSGPVTIVDVFDMDQQLA